MTIDSSTGIVSWTPTDAQAVNGTHSVTVQVDDQRGGSDSQTFTISVTRVDDQPSILIPDAFILEDSGFNNNIIDLFIFTSDEEDSDTALTFLITSQSNQGVVSCIVDSDRFIDCTTQFNQNGFSDVTVRVSDTGGLTDTDTFRVKVTPVNDLPVLNPIGSKSVNENQFLQFTISGSDPDGDSLSFSASNLPSGASFSGPTFSWTPNFNQAGSFQLTFTVSDGNGGTDSETITITVNDVNRAPILNSIGNKAINENSNLQFTISGSDPDGDSISFSALNLPSGATFNQAIRTFSWTPSFLQSGSFQVTFTVSDGFLTDSEQVTITVNDVNRLPVITSTPTTTATEDILYTYDVDATDPDTNNVLIFLVSGPSGMTIDSSTGIVSWTPTDAQAVNGTHSVTVQVDDQRGGSDSQTFTITVTRVDDPPLILIPDAFILEDSGFINNLIDLSLFVSDEEDPFSSLILSIISQSNTGIVSCIIDTSDFIDCTTVLNQNGFSDVIISVTDTSAQTSLDTFRVNIIPVNDGPTTTILQPVAPLNTFVEGLIVTFNASAFDIDNDPLTFTLDFGDGISALGPVVSNQITLGHIYSTVGLYNVTLSVTDGISTAIDTTQVIITPFTVSIVADKTSGTEPLMIQFDSLLNGGNGPFIYEWDFNSDGKIDSTSSSPKAIFKEEGIFIVKLKVTDADGDMAMSTLEIKIEKGPSKTSRKKIHISQIRFLEVVQAGDDLEVTINLENKNTLKTRELSVSVLIPELGLRKKVGNDKLKSGEDDSKRVLITIPNNTKPGLYDILITVNDHDTNRRIWRELRVI